MATRTTKKAATKKASAKKVADAKAEARLSIITDGVDTAKAGKLPPGTVKLSAQGLTIDVQRLSRSLLRDQRARLVSSMGCISNPGGPGC
jgi:hypothetical protein